MKIALVLLVLSISGAIAEETKPAEVKPPAVSAEHRASFWRREAEIIRAQQQAATAQTALSAAIAELQKDCGDKFVAVLDSKDGEPTCEAKIPQPEATPAK